ncbi:MAG: response regulator [Leptolyngbyaceae cyanobacterium SL_1_1]|nr:response regulator [Leptolyngbyaceae cyanobacterium SL_1_1]
MIADTPLKQQQFQKPRMLVVDDEPDNLDLLYRTFRRSFQVLRAESGQEALNLLADCGEVAIIISDQRMPEMKGTEFLSKTVPNFPDTMRIILTGFTDVEDLVEAINAGQVYRYITKPWDPDELKNVVSRAAETYEIMQQRNQELLEARQQTQLMLDIVELANSAETLAAMLPALAQVLRKTLQASGCTVRLSKSELFEPQVSDGQFVDLASSTAQPPITLTEIIETEELTQVRLPMTYRQEQIGMIALQWQSPHPLTSIAVVWLETIAQQSAIAIKSLASAV